MSDNLLDPEDLETLNPISITHRIQITSLVEKYCMQHACYHLTACMLSETCMSQSCRSHVLHMD